MKGLGERFLGIIVLSIFLLAVVGCGGGSQEQVSGNNESEESDILGVIITSPESDSFVEGEKIIFSAEITSSESCTRNREISDFHFQWSSDKVGIIGEQETFKTALSAGEHSIVCCATDDGGMIGTSKINLLIEPNLIIPKPDPIFGCMDSSAENYDSEATEDDGSCEYDIFGCIEPEAFNYNPNATIDDGSCEFLEPDPDLMLGCMDPTAENYNPDATEDDGSCEYLDPGIWPTSDHDRQGTKVSHLAGPSGELKWQKDLDTYKMTYVTLDGATIYVNETDGISALEYDGSLKWKFQVDKFQYFSPAVINTDNEMIYTTAVTTVPYMEDGEPVIMNGKEILMTEVKMFAIACSNGQEFWRTEGVQIPQSYSDYCFTGTPTIVGNSIYFRFWDTTVANGFSEYGGTAQVDITSGDIIEQKTGPSSHNCGANTFVVSLGTGKLLSNGISLKDVFVKGNIKGEETETVTPVVITGSNEKLTCTNDAIDLTYPKDYSLIIWQKTVNVNNFIVVGNIIYVVEKGVGLQPRYLKDGIKVGWVNPDLSDGALSLTADKNGLIYAVTYNKVMCVKSTTAETIWSYSYSEQDPAQNRVASAAHGNGFLVVIAGKKVMYFE